MISASLLAGALALLWWDRRLRAQEHQAARTAYLNQFRAPGRGTKGK